MLFCRAKLFVFYSLAIQGQCTRTMIKINISLGTTNRYIVSSQIPLSPSPVLISSINFIDRQISLSLRQWGRDELSDAGGVSSHESLHLLFSFSIIRPKKNGEELERVTEKTRETKQTCFFPSRALSLSRLWLSDPRSNRACSLSCFFIVLETSAIEKSLLH